MAKCTIGILLHACQLSYRIDNSGLIDPTIEEDPNIKLKSHAEITKAGYHQIAGVKPKTEGGQSETGLAAIALKPLDNGPIVISFRGTKTWADIQSDVSIMRSGLAAQHQLDGAWEFYQQIKKENPGREIILTGHSLGGHIATYVGTKAHEKENLPCAVAAVRTFNPAPFSKETAKKVAKDINSNAILENKCVNIRLSNDPISSTNTQNYLGNIFSFRSDISNIVDAHMLWAMDQSLPSSVKNTPVSSNPMDVLKENIQGMVHSYECRINKQFFSSSRLGMKNLLVLQKLQQEISSRTSGIINYSIINEKIESALKSVHGTESEKILLELRKLIPKHYLEEKTTEMKTMSSRSAP